MNLHEAKAKKKQSGNGIEKVKVKVNMADSLFCASLKILHFAHAQS